MPGGVGGTAANAAYLSRLEKRIQNPYAFRRNGIWWTRYSGTEMGKAVRFYKENVPTERGEIPVM